MTGDRRLGISWAPKCAQVYPDGTPTGQRGAWCVHRRIRVPTTVMHRGTTIVFTPKVNWPQMYLDGGHGLPRWPQQWVISALIASDQTRRGLDRVRELEKWRRQFKIGQRKDEEDRLVDVTVAHAKGFKNIAEQVGARAPSREEHLRSRAEAERLAALADSEFEAEMEDDRLV